MFRFKASAFAVHVTGWILFLLFPLLFLSNGNSIKEAGNILLSPFYWLFCLTYILLFYLNAGYLMPRFFFVGKYMVYVLVMVGLFTIVYYLQPFDKLLGSHNGTTQLLPPVRNTLPHRAAPPGVMFDGTDRPERLPPNGDHIGPPPFGRPLGGPEPGRGFPGTPGWGVFHHRDHVDLVSLFLFVIVAALSISIRSVQQWQTTAQKVAKTEAEKANAELSFLKAQINPHFLFNTLNNIYTLSIMNSPHTSESIMKLSNIMRYVTDEVNENLVLLQHDINCLQDYIELQRLRLGKKTTVNFSVNGTVASQKIAPLMLMSFVENTFKYGISKKEQSEINIVINAGDSELLFYCENAIFGERAVTERTGIGIANAKQRLEQLYYKKHRLTIDTNDRRFKVTLSLQY